MPSPRSTALPGGPRIAALRSRQYAASRWPRTRAISTPAASTTPFNPALRNSKASRMSVSHSQAYQGAPGFENEYRSCRGTLCWSRMCSPVRMCQPTSASTSRDCQPCAPVLMNNHAIRAAKKSRKARAPSSRLQRLSAIECSLAGREGEAKAATLDCGVIPAYLFASSTPAL